MRDVRLTEEEEIDSPVTAILREQEDFDNQLMTCSDCKHWKKWEEKPHTFGPKTLSVGDCFESAFAKTFGKSVTAHNREPCKSFQKKVAQ